VGTCLVKQVVTQLVVLHRGVFNDSKHNADHKLSKAHGTEFWTLDLELSQASDNKIMKPKV
jgi:aspartyl/asparaginyl-tRNA synthetase